MIPLRILRALQVGAALAAAALGTRASGFEIESLSSPINRNGSFRLDGVSFNITHFTPGFAASVRQNQGRGASGYPRSDENRWETVALFGHQTASYRLTIRQALERIDARAFRLRQTVSSPAPGGTPTQELSLVVSLPLALAAGRAFEADGKRLVFPAEPAAQPALFNARAVHRLVLPSSSGSIAIEGTFDVLVQDQRRWRDNTFVARIRFPLPAGQPLTESSLVTTLRFIPWESTPLSLREAVNRGFSDKVAGDGRGGWTDQGPDNDLSALPPGPLKSCGVSFAILDPGRNDGHSAVVIGRATGHEGLPLETAVSIAANETGPWKNLYLLHAAAWLPSPANQTIGELIVCHADGTEKSFPIRAGHDVGNWWSPVPLPNAAVGWQGRNRRSDVGLYVSRFPLDGEPVQSIRFRAAGNALWMIAGLSASADDIVPGRQKIPVEIRPGADWTPCEHTLDIEPGSVFDFSRLIDAPAGKHGRIVITPAGHFEFANRPGQRVRFWGVNLTHSANYLGHDEADLLAERLARSGYNTVRLHHIDRELVSGDHPASQPLNPGRLDQLDYLFAALKKHGLYLNIDLYSLRGFTPAEVKTMGFTREEDLRNQFKTLLPLSDEVFDNWARYARALLTHHNPYTGLTWGEDPALIGICPVNEDGIPYRLEIEALPSVRQRYRQAFAAWWEQPANREKASGDKTVGFNRFVHETQAAGDARMKAFIRGLGVPTPVTGTNFSNTEGLAYVRQHLDYVDNHRYADHPRFPRQHWRLPYLFTQLSVTRGEASPVPRDLMPSRQWAKPYVVTEFNFVRPNRYRAEGGVLMPAYASLQDWDALYNFSYADTDTMAVAGGTRGIFSLSADPIGLLADRLSAVIFLRQDIAPARRAIGYAVDPRHAFQKLNQDFPRAFSALGLVSRIGSGTASPQEERTRHGLDAVVTTAAQTAGPGVYAADTGLVRRLLDAGVLPPGSIDEARKRYRSDTGEIELDAGEGSVRVVTPRSELFVLPPRHRLEGAFVSSGANDGASGATVAVVSADDRPLADSGRILVLHLTDALPTGMRFADQDRRLVEDWGGAPHLVQAGEASLRLRLATGQTWRAWAVSESGRRLHEVPLTRDGDAWLLSADTVAPEGARLAYELSAH